MAIEWQAPAHDIPHAEGAATVEACRAIAEQLEGVKDEIKRHNALLAETARARQMAVSPPMFTRDMGLGTGGS